MQRSGVTVASSIEATEQLAILKADVRRVVARLALEPAVGRREVERAAGEVAEPAMSAELVALAIDDADLDPIGHLICALALRRAVIGTDVETPWRAILAWRASAAIYDLGNLGLFGLRLALLNDALADPESLGPRAMLHFQRANTRQALGERNESDSALVMDDLRAACAIAFDERDVNVLTRVLLVLARRLGASPETDAVSIATLDAQVVTLLEHDLPTHHLAMLLQARATLARGRKPKWAVEYLEAAIAVLPKDAELRTEIAAELISTLLIAGRPLDAVTRGRELLDASRGHPATLSAALLHAAFGHALAATGKLEDGRWYLRTALDGVRGRDPRNATIVRLHLANLELAAGQPAAAADHIHAIEDQGPAIGIDQQRDLAALQAQLAATRGDAAGQRQAFQRSEALADDPAERRRLRLERVLAEVSDGSVVPDLGEVLTEAAALDANDVIDSLLMKIVVAPEVNLGAAAEATIRAWAERRRLPSIVARLVHQGGHLNAALAILRQAHARADSLVLDERLRCVHMLVCLLPATDTAERWAYCEELEDLLERVGDDAHARLDLAVGMRTSAGQDLDRLRRASTHAERALKQVSDARTVEHAHHVLAGLSIAIIKATLPASTEEAAATTAWLEGDLRFAPPDRGEVRLSAASLLLAAGPLVHPLALATARRLLRLARRDLRATSGHGAAALPRYKARLEWIDRRHSGMGGGDQGEAGPFDDAPSWLIAFVADGKDVPTDPAADVDEALAMAWAARPDLHARLRQEIDRRHAARASTEDVHQQAVSSFNAGLRLLNEVRRQPLAPSARNTLRRARLRLDEVVELARRHRLPELFDFLISRGNAWRQGPESDLELALACYEEASPLVSPRDNRATLRKVHADGLRERGRPEDLRQAEILLREVLKVRRDGYLRAEALISAAQVAVRHPDRDEGARAREVAEHLMAAVRAHPPTAVQVLVHLVETLVTWESLAPSDDRPRTYREELRRTFPDRGAQIGARADRADVAPHLVSMLSDPAAKLFMEVRQRLMTARERTAIPEQLARRMGPARLQQMEEEAVRTSLVDRPDDAEQLLTQLAAVIDPAAKPGALAAATLLLAHLARHGRRKVADVQAATNTAAEAIARVKDPHVASLFLREVALAWSPIHPDGDPVCDFAVAAILLRRAVEIEGGRDVALIDTLGFLARAVRYSATGPGETHLREARDLYQTALGKARNDGDPMVIANILANLAEVDAQVGEGGRRARLERALQLIEEAVTLAPDPARKAGYQASLAWTRAQLGFAAEGAESVRWLQHAKTTFDLVDRGRLYPSDQRHFDRNRATTISALVERDGDRATAIGRYRDEVARLADAAEPHALATAKHNLASALLFGDLAPADDLREGLRLANEATLIRTIERDARHCWETAHDAGRAIAQQLDLGRAKELGMSLRQAWLEGCRWLRLAITAARALGAGQELADAGMALSMMAAHTRATVEAEATAEEAWSAVREAMPYLLLTPTYRTHEADHALRVAWSLARCHAAEAVAAGAPGIAFMLVGDRAAAVEHWLLRAQLPARRPVRARLEQPPGIPTTSWRQWHAALTAGDERALADALRTIRADTPNFLHEEGDGTWVSAWLEAHPGGAAIAAFVVESGFMVWLVTRAADGRSRTCILGLHGPPVPMHPGELAERLCKAGHNPEVTYDAQKVVASWARDHLATPVGRLLGGPPRSILWCPGPVLRLIAPGGIWPGSAIATTITMEGPAQRTAPGRERSTLIALADPGPGTPHAVLGAHGRSVIDRLAAAAGERGRVRRMASDGAKFGRALQGEDATVIDAPVSPHDLLVQAAEHAVVVVVAHGELTDRGAALICIDARGAIVPLTDDMLAASPLAFAGSTIILLTCSAGQVTADLADPGGLAGTLLTAGARCVVAPMWPVRLDVAADVAEAVLRGGAFGDEPASAVAHVQRSARSTDAPFEVAPKFTAEHVWRLGFVAWVG